MKSILDDRRRCLICGSAANIEKHHIYFGSLRKKSERLGFFCYLCAYHHRDNKAGAHGNRALDLQLKEACQREYEKTHSRAEFIALIGRNYL